MLNQSLSDEFGRVEVIDRKMHIRGLMRGWLMSYLQLLAILYACTASGQVTFDPVITNYDRQHGLSSSLVLSLAMDRRGVLWVGTPEGLHRFDGTSFEVYNRYKDGLIADEVHNIAVAPDGMLLLNHKSANTSDGNEITVFDPVHSRVVDKEVFFGKVSDLVDQVGNQLLPMREGIIWHSYETDFALIKGVDGTWSKSTALPLPGTESLDDSYDIVELEDAVLLVRYNLIVRCDKSLNDCEVVRMVPQAPGSLYTSLIDPLHLVVFEDNQDYQQAVVSIKDFLADPSMLEELERPFRSQSVHAIDHMDSTMIISDGESILLSNYDHTEQYVIATKADDGLAAFGDLSTVSLFDGSSYWIGTRNKGLYQVSRKAVFFDEIITNTQQRNIKVSEAGELWLNNSLTPCTRLVCNARDDVRMSPALVTTSDGSIWHFTLYDLILRTRPDGTRDTFFNDEKSLYNWWPYVDSLDRIWFYGDKHYFDTRLDTFLQGPNRTQLPDDTIVFFDHLNPDGTRWICTSDGLYIMSPGGARSHLHRGGRDKRYLPTNLIHHYYQYSDTLCYFATGDLGLVKWNRLTHQFTTYNLNNGLSSNKVHAIYPDSRGVLWLNTENGVIAFHMDTEQVVRFGKQDGLSFLEGNRVSHYRHTDGSIYFGTIGSVVRFHPDSIYADLSRSSDIPLMVVGAREKDADEWEAVPFSQDSTGVYKIFTFQKDGAIKFGPLGYEAPHRYQLVASTRQRSYQILDGELIYSDLPYGHHVITVEALLLGESVTDPIAVVLDYPAPWHKTGWFYGLTMLLILLLVYAIIRWRTYSYSQRAMALEASIAERTAELRNQAQTIREQKSGLEAALAHQVTLYSELQHRVKNNLQYILSLIDLQELHDDTSTSGDSDQLRNRIFAIARIQDLLHGGVDQGSLTTQQYLSTMLNEASTLYTTAIDCHVSVDEEAQDLTFDTMVPLGITLTELLINSHKHNPHVQSLRIEVQCTCHKDHYCLSYRDNGGGFKADPLQSSSTGWIVIKSMARQLGGYVSWHNDAGACIEFYFYEKNAQKSTNRRRRGTHRS